eukprot:gene2595-3288_t
MADTEQRYRTQWTEDRHKWLTSRYKSMATWMGNAKEVVRTKEETWGLSPEMEILLTEVLGCHTQCNVTPWNALKSMENTIMKHTEDRTEEEEGNPTIPLYRALFMYLTEEDMDEVIRAYKDLTNPQIKRSITFFNTGPDAGDRITRMVGEVNLHIEGPAQVGWHDRE